MSRSFEQYAAERLAELLEEEVHADLTPNQISVIQTDYDDTRRFLVTIQLTMDCVYDKKLDAADATTRIARAVKSLGQDRWIASVRIVTAQAERKGLAGKWQYRTVADFLVKEGVQW